jgi:hypothetical protein
MASIFEHLGYYKEYYYNGIFYGSVNISEPDRLTIGWTGKRTEILKEDVVFRKGKLKSGWEVSTMIYPLCGRHIKSL